MRISDWSSDVCSSDLAEARFLLGRIHLKLGDARSAEKELLRARELGLSDPELDLLLAYSQLGQQEFDAVVSGIDEELKADRALERDLVVARGEALLGRDRKSSLNTRH